MIFERIISGRYCSHKRWKCFRSSIGESPEKQWGTNGGGGGGGWGGTYMGFPEHVDSVWV